MDDEPADDYRQTIRRRRHLSHEYRVRFRPPDYEELNEIRVFFGLTWPEFWHYVALLLRQRMGGGSP